MKQATADAEAHAVAGVNPEVRPEVSPYSALAARLYRERLARLASVGRRVREFQAR